MDRPDAAGIAQSGENAAHFHVVSAALAERLKDLNATRPALTGFWSSIRVSRGVRRRAPESKRSSPLTVSRRTSSRLCRGTLPGHPHPAAEHARQRRSAGCRAAHGASAEVAPEAWSSTTSTPILPSRITLADLRAPQAGRGFASRPFRWRRADARMTLSCAGETERACYMRDPHCTCQSPQTASVQCPLHHLASSVFT